jgi:YegS/Rv2252/BmrU family lipid kinase
MARRVLVILNPAAGGGRGARALPAYERALHNHGVEYRVERTTGIDHARALAREAAANGEVAAAFGGDGLVGAVAGALQGTGALLGILPGGRGNDLARVLGIPRSPAGAAKVLATAEPRPLDLAEVDGRPFCGIASCGFDSDANRIANEATWLRGNLVYVYAALRALAAWKPARFTLALDGVPRELEGWSVVAANSKAYGGGMYIAPDAALDDGLLDVVTCGAISKPGFLRQLPRVFRGRHVDHPNFTVARAHEVTIAADRPFTVYADGDPIGDLPVTVRSLPAAVQVIAP